MNIIFGANGESGRALLALLPQEQVIAALRQASDDAFFANRTSDVVDVLDEQAVNICLKKHQPNLIVSFVGGKNEQGIRSDAVGNINIVQAACKHTPDAHIILISSMGCGEQWEHTNETIRQFLGEALLAKTEAEQVLRQQAKNWTIVRPCGLDNSEASEYCLEEGRLTMPAQYISRQSLARAIAKIMQNPNEHNHKIYSLVKQ